jgi:hypothetical protein
MSWTRTNVTECHFRIANRIFGKVQFWDGVWTARIKAKDGRVTLWRGLETLGQRKSLEAAQMLIELRVLKAIEKN